MKWLKHYSDSFDDEVISELVDRFGMEGYGIWWRILEIIAKQMDGTSRTFVSYSSKKWCSLITITPKKFQKVVGFLQNAGKFTVENSDNSITIGCPNLLKIKDEYTSKKGKKSGQSPASVGTPTKEKEKEEDKEKEKEEDKEKEKKEVLAFWDYYILKTKRKFQLTEINKKLISDGLKKRSLEDMKIAVDNFIQDDWVDRPNRMDLVYCIGVRSKVDNLERWFNWTKPTPHKFGEPEEDVIGDLKR